MLAKGANRPVPLSGRRWANAFAVGLLVLAGVVGCRAKGRESQPKTNQKPSPPPMKNSENPVNKSVSFRTDPPGEAWEFDPDEPQAGLVLHHKGQSLDKARLALVLFHGYGAEGDDLLGLSRVLHAESDVAFVFPEAPVSLPMGGRAWFRRDRTNFSLGVRRAEALLRSLHRQFPDLTFVVGGFSQGAMLAANLVELGDLPIMAGLLFSPADQLEKSPQAGRVPLFISHGTLDPVLPFDGTERLRDKFADAGHPITWVSFPGRHQIPRQVIDEVNLFLGAVAERPPSSNN